MTATTLNLPDADEMEAKIIEAIKTVYDPEIPVNIYELGLIYSLNVDCLLYTSPSPRDGLLSRMPSSA